MTDTKPAESEQGSPYDLWPDEIAGSSETVPEASQPVENAFPPEEPERFDAPFEAPFIPVAYTPESTEQTVRKSGLAWSAGIVLFGSVAFMLFIGWLADLLLGSSPWGLVGGIILGGIIGFVQFFRITSSIFNPPKDIPDHRPLLTRDEHDRE